MHRTLQVLGKVRGEIAARLHDALLECLVDQSQAVARLDQLERQCEELVSIRRIDRAQVRFHCARQDLLECRQVLVPDEAVLLEEFVPGRQSAEQLDHRLRHLESDPHEIGRQRGFVEHAPHIGIPGEVLHIESLADRRAEQQVLGERGVAVVARRVETLDPALGTCGGESIVHGHPCAEQLVPQLRRFRHIGAALEAELEDGLLEVYHL